MTAIQSAFSAALDQFDLGHQTVLVAVSGGIDSTTLLHLLSHARIDRNLTIHVAHVDHALREESGDDAKFVEHQAHVANAPFHTRRVDVRGYAAEHGCGIEAAARKLRYSFLEETAVRIGAQTVLTGHTADDVIETVLMHLSRGGSVRALAGIPHERPLCDDVRVIRPLLDVSRTDIETYALENGLKWVDDASNLDTVHARNRVRHELLPVMRNFLGPGVGSNVLRFARMMGEVATLIESMASNIRDSLITGRPESVQLSLVVISTQPRVVVDHLLQQELRLGHIDRDRLFSLVKSDVGTAASLSGGRMAIRDRGFIAISNPTDAMSNQSEFEVHVSDDTYHVGRQTIRIQLVDGQPAPAIMTSQTSIDIDVDEIQGRLHCRPWRSGDRIRLEGASGSKLVSDVLTDAKFDHSRRSSVHVLADEQGILWVCGVRQADRARCSDGTVRYLHCQMD